MCIKKNWFSSVIIFVQWNTTQKINDLEVNISTKIRKHTIYIKCSFVFALLFIKEFQTCNRRHNSILNPKYTHHPASIIINSTQFMSTLLHLYAIYFSFSFLLWRKSQTFCEYLWILHYLWKIMIWTQLHHCHT